MPSATVVTAAVIFKEGKILIARRHNGDWEFPGGKLEPGETLEECLVREVLEELGLHIDIIRPFLIVDHDYPTKRIRLHSYVCTWIRGKPVANDHSCLDWVTIERLRDFAFAAADGPIVRKLLEELGQIPV
jgi:mutator protein MutT